MAVDRESEELTKRIEAEMYAAMGRYDRTHSLNFTEPDCWTEAVSPLVTRIVELEERGRKEVSDRVHAEQLHAALVRDKDERIEALELDIASVCAAYNAVADGYTQRGDKISALESKLAQKDADLVSAAFTIGRLQATIQERETAVLVLSQLVGRGGRS